GWSVDLRALDVELLHLELKPLAGEAEALRGAADVTAGLEERGSNRLPLAVALALGERSSGRALAAVAHREDRRRQVPRLDPSLTGERRRPAHHVLELADVPRPGVRQEKSERLAGDLHRSLAQLREDVADQRLDVIGPLSERR